MEMMSVYAAQMEELQENATGTINVREVVACSDNALAAAVLAGDEDAFRELYERHRQAVARLAYRFFSRREQVEDVIQDTFTKAYLALANFRGAHERSFISWLQQIAVRVCYDELRRPMHQAEQAAADLTEDETEFLERRLAAIAEGRTTEDELMSRDLAGKLLSRLSAEDRLVLTLLHGEEQSSAEIAKLTGWSEGKVRVRALRARRSIQRVIQKFL
jgi:RNA polymerase sigma-70 factor (ECF subfamily)